MFIFVYKVINDYFNMEIFEFIEHFSHFLFLIDNSLNLNFHNYNYAECMHRQNFNYFNPLSSFSDFNNFSTYVSNPINFVEAQNNVQNTLLIDRNVDFDPHK